MPALRTLLDGVHVATVSTADFELVSVAVSGSRTDTAPAYLDISASHHPLNEAATFLLWADHVAIYPGQILTVEFLADAETSAPGHTLEELYQPSGEAVTGDFTITPELLDRLARAPRQRDTCALQLDSTQGTHLALNTDDATHGFRFSVLWNIWRQNPAQATMSLCSHTLDNLRRRARGAYHAQEQLHHADTVSLTVCG